MENVKNWSAGKKIVPLQVRTTIEEARLIRDAATRAGKTISAFVMEAVRKALKK